MSFPKENLSPPFDYSDERLNDDGEQEYVWSGFQLRVEAKALIMQRDGDEFVSPRKHQEIERHLGHIVFELAYRTGAMEDYIAMHRDAVSDKQAG